MRDTNRTETLLSLAPMAGYTDEAFRLICAEWGARETVTEMVSARALYHGDRKSGRLMRVDPAEKGVTLQIFGSEPEIMAEAVKRHINPLEVYAAIDINMGCPVPKIVKNGEGAALLRDPDLAFRVSEAVVEASRIPVTVKIRTGWDLNEQNYMEVGRRLEQTGIKRITLHGRTRSQYYTGSANWEAIAELAEALTIPVIGNGDICDVETAMMRLRETRVSGIAIGRGAIGRPWLFRQITQALQDEPVTDLTLREKAEVGLAQLAMTVARKGEDLGVIQMRKHLLQYVKGWKDASALKQNILAETTQDGVRRVLEAYLHEHENS